MSVARKELIKSPEDDREYRGLILANGIKAVLVSDPSTDKSAAALDVNVGSLSDPNELPGLVRAIRKSRHRVFIKDLKAARMCEMRKDTKFRIRIPKRIMNIHIKFTFICEIIAI